MAIEIADALDAAHRPELSIETSSLRTSSSLSEGSQNPRFWASESYSRGKHDCVRMAPPTIESSAEHLTSPGAASELSLTCRLNKYGRKNWTHGRTCFRLERFCTRWRLGQLPFRGESSAQSSMHLEQSAYSRRAAESRRTSLRLEDIINRALEKDRELRYQHASEIRSELQRLKRDTESRQVGDCDCAVARFSQNDDFNGPLRVLLGLSP